MRVLVVGEALVDVVTVEGGPAVEHVGGSPLNVAVGLGRLGVPTTFAAQVGDDEHGQRIVEHLAASGVELVPLRPVPRRTGTAVATLSADGSARYAFDLTWGPGDLPGLEGYDALHVGSLGAALRPGAARVVALAAEARGRGIPVSFDPNVRLAVEPDHRVWCRAFTDLLPHASVVKLSDEDGGVLLPGYRPPDLARTLARSDRLVMVTGGAAGSWAAAGSSAARASAAATGVVDTIGAGDSFMAAALAWLVRHAWRTDDLDALTAYASAAAGITCSRPGADPPWSTELPDDHPHHSRRTHARATR